MKLSRNICLFVAGCFSALLCASCAKVEESGYCEQDYGHIQFKLYKSASYASTKSIDYLGEIAKVKVTLDYGGQQISQTLVMDAHDAQTAEYGLRSEKLRLLSGHYTLKMYELYDKLDSSIVKNIPVDSLSTFEVVPGGLTIHDMVADVTPRGMARFTLTKDFSDFKDTPVTKAGGDSYTFDEISYATLVVRHADGTPTTFENLEADFSMHFNEKDDKEDGYRTSSSLCDTILFLRAGDDKVESFAVYSESKTLLDASSLKDVVFSVSDNELTEVDVPVKLEEGSDDELNYIRDYYALYEIWKSLNGEDWY